MKIVMGALVAFVVAVAGWAVQSEGLRSKLPAAVLAAVDENRPGVEIESLDVEEEKGITLYDIEFKDDQGEIEVAEDGTVLDVVTIIQLEEVPEAAAAVIERAARGKALKRVEKSEVRSRLDVVAGKGQLTPLSTPEYVYEAEFKGGGEVEVAADGRIIKGPKFMGKAATPEK